MGVSGREGKLVALAAKLNGGVSSICVGGSVASLGAFGSISHSISYRIP